MASIPALFSVGLMALFVFLVFGVVGIQLWSGVMSGECGFRGSGERCALPCASALCQPAYGDSCPAGYVSEPASITCCIPLHQCEFHG
jgi:hypothetical protein